MNSPQSKASLLKALEQGVIHDLGDEVKNLCLQRVVVGIFFTGVQLNNGIGAMCATPVKSVPAAVCCTSSVNALPTPGKLAGKPVLDVLEDLHKPKQDLRRAIAIASLNALIETLWQTRGDPPVQIAGKGDAFQLLEFKPDDKVVLVGAFPPYMRELCQRKQDFKVLELDPSVLKPHEMPYFAPADTAPEVVPWADIFITTGTTLINGTLDALLGYVKPRARVAVIGPTTPLYPEPFKHRGVNLIGGSRVNDPQTLLDLLAEGTSGYHFFEKTVDRISLLISD